MSTSYQTEEMLVTALLQRLSADENPWGATSTGREFGYPSGRADVVAITAGGMVVAFEAKLRRWREALHQAYRNRCFADLSFVVLPKDIAVRATIFSEEFRRRGVGICYLSDVDGIVVLYACDEAAPVLPWLRAAAVESIRGAPSE